MFRLAEIRPSMNSQIILQDNNINKYKQAYLPFTLTVQGLTLQSAALLDTGAALSVMDISYLNKLFPNETEKQIT